jgi:hypothetical protein
MFELPIPVPPFSVMQYWHTRSDKEPANQWLRAVIVELFQGP